MIVTGTDPRNIATVSDLLQSKLIVEVLRLVAVNPSLRPLLVLAAETVNQRDGFTLTAEDIRIACEEFGAIVGYRTDVCVHPSKMGAEQTPNPLPALEPEKKETVN